MTNLYTKNGQPLQQQGDDVFSLSGRHIGRIHGDKVYGPDGRYAGTIDSGRVVYRSPDSASSVGTFDRSKDIPEAVSARIAGAAMWGDEPDLPD
jgi:hypothetical protein